MSQSIIDLLNNPAGTQALFAPQTISGTNAGFSTSIYCENLNDPLNAILMVGSPIASGFANSGLVVVVEEYNTDGSSSGSWTTISGMAFASIASGVTNQVQVVRGNRQYAYVRANANTVGGGNASFTASCVVVGQAKYTASGNPTGVTAANSGQPIFGKGASLYPST